MRFTLAEFSGGPGPWTAPHLHREMEESFFVLGDFVFAVGEDTTSAVQGSYLLSPRGTRHTFEAGDAGGRVLVLMVPGGLEGMFFELGGLASDAIRGPAVRAAISARYDSVPV